MKESITLSTAKIILKNKRDKLLRARHPWLFSGGIQQVEGKPSLGETVEVISAQGDLVGLGAYSPESQIRVRMWTVLNENIDKEFFRKRIQQAIDSREHLGITTTNTGYRLIAAESDGFPGLVVDYYDGYLIAQFLSAGVERWKATIVDLLAEMTQCKGIYERSDVAVRNKEGLEQQTGVLFGETPPARINIREQGRQYIVDVVEGHKTGFYLDQRDNRSLLSAYTKDKSVLNCFSYTGGFSIAALQGGASSVVNIDASESALALSEQTHALNKWDDKSVEHVQGDVFKLLREYRDKGKKFDVIVLDPPKFADNKGQIKRAARGYKDINLLAFSLLKPHGLLFTFSCSGLMEFGLFQKIVADGALDAQISARIVHKLGQASDHPTALPFPEGFYLKGLVCEAVGSV
jgi:23S rRNA (cytosine1962-C5)-methyltransferase